MPNMANGQFDLERFREYLGLLARLQVSADLQARIDLSGVVQQTLLDAHRNWSQMQAVEEGAIVAWLRSILGANLADEFRKHAALKRDARRERSLEATMEHSSARLVGLLAAEQTSPSQGAIRNEEAVRLATALAQLPFDQRRAVELHHLQGQTLAATATALGRSKAAVAGLLHRALENLRDLLDSGGTQ